MNANFWFVNGSIVSQVSNMWKHITREKKKQIQNLVIENFPLNWVSISLKYNLKNGDLQSFAIIWYTHTHTKQNKTKQKKSTEKKKNVLT